MSDVYSVCLVYSFDFVQLLISLQQPNTILALKRNPAVDNITISDSLYKCVTSSEYNILNFM